MESIQKHSTFFLTWNIGEKDFQDPEKQVPKSNLVKEWLIPQLLVKNQPSSQTGASLPNLVVIGLQECNPQLADSYQDMFFQTLSEYGYDKLAHDEKLIHYGTPNGEKFENSETYGYSFPMFVFGLRSDNSEAVHNHSSSSLSTTLSRDIFREQAQPDKNHKNNVNNKGCVVTRFVYDGVRYKIANCHFLHAYIGLENRLRQQRVLQDEYAFKTVDNADGQPDSGAGISEVILSEEKHKKEIDSILKLDKTMTESDVKPQSESHAHSNFPVLNTHYDHDVFYQMGDLNYRINAKTPDSIKKEPTKAKRVENRDHFSEEEAQIFQSEFDEIVDISEADKAPEMFYPHRDQLSIAKSDKEKTEFQGFSEMQIGFKPTYKRSENGKYDREEPRIPGWCDRILWKNNLDNKADDLVAVAGPIFSVVGLKYDSIEAVTSDHKPVYLVTETGPMKNASSSSTLET